MIHVIFPKTEELSTHGEKIKTLIVCLKECSLKEKKVCHRQILIVKRENCHVLSRLIESEENFSCISKFSMVGSNLESVLPVTPAVVESSVKLRFRSRMGADTVYHIRRICIEGPETLFTQTLEDHYKKAKNHKMALWISVHHAVPIAKSWHSKS